MDTKREDHGTMREIGKTPKRRDKLLAIGAAGSLAAAVCFLADVLYKAYLFRAWKQADILVFYDRGFFYEISWLLLCSGSACLLWGIRGLLMERDRKRAEKENHAENEPKENIDLEIEERTGLIP